ncbi:MAG: DUF1573 domain-containing protein [Chitinophagaceae bacterium]|nr:DUF1573 domain-containing protein [Chitinophagaceae bacterium]MBK9379816.1 DUF1573 domain-containing protein [Chitinophagaceae bacterium]MBL0304568.1 DUF1573 domain-containing protein [Chitinophagaceae bacterium]MBP6215117.1 DUF1573 domain-containing protein [Chitinophagaceae bacterium]HQV61217.1 DUF1573 domain-containing protein [Chitinophagaceae bacterium]
MKKIFFLATAFVFSLGAFAQTKVDETVKMNTEKHDFGKIKQGVPITYYFEIKNISDKPIVVENSWASCGCTTPEKIVDPIMPGGVAKLKVEYNAAAVAPFTKDVYIKFAGIEQTKTLQITGEVLSAEAYEIYVKEKGAKTPAPKKG